MLSITWSTARRERQTDIYGKIYREREEPNWFKRPDRSLRALVEVVRGSRYRTALSLGVGNGVNEEHLAYLGVNVVCLDFHARPLEVLRNRAVEKGLSHRLLPVMADLTHLPHVLDALDLMKSFDIVLGMKVLQIFSIEEQAAVLAMIKEHTNKGGINLVSRVGIASREEVSEQERTLVESYTDWKVLARGRNAGAKKGRIVYVMAKRE